MVSEDITRSLAAPLQWRRSRNEKGVRRPSAAYYSDWLVAGNDTAYYMALTVTAYSVTLHRHKPMHCN